MNSVSSVEELLAQVDEVDPKRGSSSFTLWVPNSLTLGGNAVTQDVAMAVVLDRVLSQRASFQTGLSAEGVGRRYNYRFEGG